MAGANLGLNGTPAPELNGVRVYFGDRQAELLAVSPIWIVLRVPTELPSMGTVAVHVEFNGAVSNPVQVHIVPQDAGLLSMDDSGRGQANARNQDGTLNTPDNPARAGSVIRLYFTGAEPDTTSLSVTADQKPLTVISASPVQGFVPGLFEVFVQVNDPGDRNIRLNGSPAVTISVR